MENKTSHIAQNPIKLDNRIYTQKIDYKPNGFWYGVDNGWANWVESEMPEWAGSYEYELYINNINILKINSAMQLESFNNKYKHEEKIALSKYTRNLINWKNVSLDYDGIEISPYQWDYRHDSNFDWYCTWDVASGCIWRNLKNIKLELTKKYI